MASTTSEDTDFPHDHSGAPDDACERNDYQQCCKCFLTGVQDGEVAVFTRTDFSTVRAGALRRCPWCYIWLQAVTCYRREWLSKNISETELRLQAHCNLVPIFPTGVISIIISVLPTNVEFEKIHLQLSAQKGCEPPLMGLEQVAQLPPRSDDDSCLRQVSEWLECCSTTHAGCSSNDIVRLPTRVLDVEHSELYLVETNGRLGSYAALSHCWGTDEMRGMSLPTTTKANIVEHSIHGIPWQQLTKSFQDAITVTRRLDLKYLWIDALCIIQDDADDWTHEASRMNDVYSCARLVIAATGASHGSQGLFWSRSSFNICGPSQPDSQAIVQSDPEVIHATFRTETVTQSNQLPVLARAWCLQERLLAVRSVHFTEPDILFECATSVSCECDKDLRLVQPGDQNLKILCARIFSQHPSASIDERLSLWYQVLKDYCMRSLTFKRDKLPALSGLARRLHVSTLGSYYAGLWECSLPGALLWRNSSEEVLPRRHSPYMAPTWSCLSLDSGNYFTQLFEPLRVFCQIQHVACTLASADPFGRILDGHIILRCPLASMKLGSSSEVNVAYFLYLEAHTYSFTPDVAISQPGHDDYIADGAMVPVALILSVENYRPEGSPQEMGIALRPGRNNTAAYERIGLVRRHSSEPLDVSKVPVQEITIV